MMAALLAFLSGCSQGRLVEGGLYCVPGEKGGYSVIKILKLDPQGVHLRLYSNHFPEPPRQIDESTLYMAGMDRKPDEAMGMGHLPVSRKSFETWKPHFVQQSTVSEAELEGYKIWSEAKGGYF